MSSSSCTTDTPPRPAIARAVESHQEAASAALDLHEGISDADAPSRCDRWPDHLFLESTLGALVRGRCKSTNLCDYCARLAAVENAEVLALDALNGVAPLVWMVLTTPSTQPEQRHYYDSRRQFQRAVRRRFPEAEFAWMLEFTTGYGSGAGGARRPHWNAIIKGVTDHDEDQAQLLDCAHEVWCPRQGANLAAQFVGSIGEMGGLMRYLALHFQKESQSPPTGWTGHRSTKTRGYLWLPTPEARDAARASLRYKREVWKLRASGLTAEQVHEAALRAVYEASELAWTLVRQVTLPATWTDEDLPATWSEVLMPV